MRAGESIGDAAEHALDAAAEFDAGGRSLIDAFAAGLITGLHPWPAGTLRMNTTMHGTGARWSPRAWFVAVRHWLEHIPLDIILVAMRIGVGSVFFKAGLLKYRVVRVRREAVRGRVQSADSHAARRGPRHDVQRADLARVSVSGLSVSGPCDSIRDPANPRLDYGHPVVAVSHQLGMSKGCTSLSIRVRGQRTSYGHRSSCSSSRAVLARSRSPS